MKIFKYSFIIFIVLFVFHNCKTNKSNSNREANNKKTTKKKKIKINYKYARNRVNIYKTKKLKKWVATLARGEKIKLLETLEGDKKDKIAKIERADGETEGYLYKRYLAGRPVVFSEDDVKVYEQPTLTSSVFERIPKGTIAFKLKEKNNWYKVHIGYIKLEGEKKWITEKWVKNGVTTEDKIVQDALIYHRALDLLNDKKEENDKKAKESLNELSKKNSFISTLAKRKLMDIEEEELL